MSGNRFGSPRRSSTNAHIRGGEPPTVRLKMNFMCLSIVTQKFEETSKEYAKVRTGYKIVGLNASKTKYTPYIYSVGGVEYAISATIAPNKRYKRSKRFWSQFLDYEAGFHIFRKRQDALYLKGSKAVVVEVQYLGLRTRGIQNGFDVDVADFVEYPDTYISTHEDMRGLTYKLNPAPKKGSKKS